LKFVSLSAVTTGLQAVATVLSAVKLITGSMKSLEDISHSNNGSEPNHTDSLRMHKRILIAGAVVGLITIGYLESIAISLKRKRNAVDQKSPQERPEAVYVSK